MIKKQKRFSRNVVTALALSFTTFFYSNAIFSSPLATPDEPPMVVTNEPADPADSYIDPSLLLNTPYPSMVIEQNNLNSAPQAINLDVIVNIGKMIWALIKAEQPIVNTQTDVASALPQGMTNWEAMIGWSTPVARPYKFHWEVWGMDMIKFDYSVVYTYGGSINGKGKYLTNVRIVPTNLKVVLGYKFNAEVNILGVTNRGTTKTPVGAMEVMVKWYLESPIGHYERSSTFYITGAGEFNQVTN